MAITMREAMLHQQRACRDLGFPFYAQLLEGCIADLADSGPIARVFEGHEQVRAGDLLPLRFLGGVHRLVLDRQAPALALHYASVGGDADASTAWPVFRRTVDDHVDVLRAGLAHPPQTNDVGRAWLLAAALASVLRDNPMPVRLFELGASAGLNLLVDRFRFEGERGGWGPMDAELVLGRTDAGPVSWPAQPLHIIEREGCDLNPIDPTTTQGRLDLTAFVWPDDRLRHERLGAALVIAQRQPAPVVRRDVLDYVRGLRPKPGAVTVVWHSVALMYLTRDHRTDVDAAMMTLGRQATTSAPVVEIGFEPEDLASTEFPLRVRRWPERRDDVIAWASPHGAAVRWAA